MGRASKDKRDIYYRKAKEEGYRARSAYKLLQIDEEFGIFEGVNRAIDLCAAPGSWSQVLSKRLGGTGCRIVAVDLQEMAPVEHVRIVQGDITTESTAMEVISHLGNEKAQLVVCDGAPDVTGMHELDEYVQHQLLLAALNITTFVLEHGGCFVAKIFRGPNTPFLTAKSEVFFENVTVVKPKSSRNASMESFLLCQNYRPPVGFQPAMMNPLMQVDGYFPSGANTFADAEQQKVMKFLICGDLSAPDADMCYDRERGAPVLAPSHPPTQAPYLESIEDRKRRRGE